MRRVFMSFQKPKPVLKRMFDKLDKIMNIFISMRSIHTIPRFDRIWRIEGGRSMKSNVVILCVTGFLLLFGLRGLASSQPADFTSKVGDDSVHLTFSCHVAYPGTEAIWVTFFMLNPKWVSGYHFVFTSFFPETHRFSVDDTGGCFVDTTGCLASIFSWISCWADYGFMVIQGGALGGDTLRMIPPRSNFSPLFRFRMDFCCIPDADTNRLEDLLLSPTFNWVWDRDGFALPLHRHHLVFCPQWPNELITWWSVPGDASRDSLVDMSDVVFLTNYLFVSGPEPCVCEAADCNNDRVINAVDIVYLINYLFLSGPAPIPGSAYCRHEDCWP
jgi:hypothetical protein